MASQQPNYRAYTVVKREGQDDFWLAIGAAFMHQDGDGYNIVLQALPIDGKIVLRVPKSDEQTAKQARESWPGLIKTNPALDAGSRPPSEGRLQSRRQPRRLLLYLRSTAACPVARRGTSRRTPLPCDYRCSYAYAYACDYRRHTSNHRHAEILM